MGALECGISRAATVFMRRLRWMTTLVLAGSILAYPAARKGAPYSGEAIYRQKCGGCHGLDGKGETTMGKTWKMRDLTSPEVQKQSDSEIAGIIARGRGHMPAYELILGDDRIDAVVAYIRELGKK